MTGFFRCIQDPVELNSATEDEMQDLLMLSEFQVQQFFTYRKQYGLFLSLYELAAIPGWDLELITSVLPFVKLELEPEEGRVWTRPSQHWLLMRYGTSFPLSRGYNTEVEDDRFQGSSSAMMVRYRLSDPGHYDIGFTLEQDGGERMLWEPEKNTYGVDYYSIHAMIENRGMIKRLILGNFSMDFGQGLIYGSGWYKGRGTDPIIGIRSNNGGIRPYRSAFENRDFLGAALTLQLGKRFQWTGFWSGVRRDALPEEEVVGEEDLYITYIRTTGLHRNEKEKDIKHRIKDQSIGTNLTYVSGNGRLKIGANAMTTHYDIPVKPVIREYNMYAFSGRSNTVAGLYGSYLWKHVLFFGESAISQSGGSAILGGFVSDLSPKVQLSLLGRKYDPQFHSFYSKAFGQDGGNTNENGLYAGLKIKPHRSWVIGLFYDRFRFPWLRYNADAPSAGSELMLSLTHQSFNGDEIRGHIRIKSNEKNHFEEGGVVNTLREENRLYIMTDWKKIFRERWWFKTRLQYSGYQFADMGANGFMAAQDAGIKLPGALDLSVRIAYFNTDNWYTRQYIYEKDLLFAYSVPSFYGEGFRFFVYVNWQISRVVSWWIKPSYTIYSDRDFVGSGLDETEGNTRFGIRTQMRIRF